MENEARKAQADYMKDYQKRNRERLRKYHKKWSQENPEKVKTYQERYWNKKALEKKEGGTGDSETDRISESDA